MKLNIFKIPKSRISELKTKFATLGLKNIKSGAYGDWQADFYFSKDIQPIKIPWVSTYSDFFPNEKPENVVYYSVYLWVNNAECFAISYGKSHFYLRPFCDHDFGTHIAKRIAEQKDVRQKSTRKFAGRKKKEIKSYTKNSKLDIESGESVDYLQSSLVQDYRVVFGKSGKFGSSVLLNPEIDKEKLPEFLESIIKIFSLPELFKLPRSLILDRSAQTIAYENKLVEEIIAQKGSADFAVNSHELVGIDFIFSGQEKYKFSYEGSVSEEFDELSIEKLNNFISEYSIQKDGVLDVKIQVIKDDATGFSKTLRESIDYIVDGQNVLLSQGKWMQFNEDYLEQLNEYIDSIDLETVEDDLIEIKGAEGEFNKKLEKYGYDNADKDFSILKVKSGTSIEAWDLKKGETVYAVKFGTAQKLGYVCDQASNTLELIGKKAHAKKLDINFKSYCLWLGISNKKALSKLSEINSIILKKK